MKMKKLNRVSTASYIFLGVVCFFSVFPFYWMVMAATNKSADIISGKLTPGLYLFSNIKSMLETVSMGRAFWNSLRTSILQTLLSILVCSAAGYGFQVYRDKKKDLLMSILLLSMMIPFASTMIPLFRMFSKVKLLNTTVGFILPSISTAFRLFARRTRLASGLSLPITFGFMPFTPKAEFIWILMSEYSEISISFLTATSLLLTR